MDVLERGEVIRHCRWEKRDLTRFSSRSKVSYALVFSTLACFRTMTHYSRCDANDCDSSTGTFDWTSLDALHHIDWAVSLLQ